MKIVVDSGIPFINGILEPFGNVVYIKGSEISKSDIKDADALVIRTRTKCSAHFLEGSGIKFIASATIGKDHVDVDYCNKNGIIFTNAAGCNSMGVVQYVLTALFSLNGSEIKGKTLGIIGAGNIGERLARLAPLFGFKILRCDPPLERVLRLDSNAFKADALRMDLTPSDYFSLDYVLANSDIVTLHVPFEESTAEMANHDFFNKMKEGAVFINASRGEVVDENALLNRIEKFSSVIIDVWKGEPIINQALLKHVFIATPHIAGYSLEGKINATVMVINSLGDFFDIMDLKNFKIEYPQAPCFEVNNNIGFLLREIFPIFETDSLLRSNPEMFEQIRSDYIYRREIPQYIIDLVKNSKLL